MAIKKFGSILRCPGPWSRAAYACACRRRKRLRPASTRSLAPNFAHRTNLQTSYANELERHIGLLANGEKGRIGVAAIDLSTGEQISILGDPALPDGQHQQDRHRGDLPRRRRQGPMDAGPKIPADDSAALESIFEHSCTGLTGPGAACQRIDRIDAHPQQQSATDALLAVIGGPNAVNALGETRRNRRVPHRPRYCNPGARRWRDRSGQLYRHSRFRDAAGHGDTAQRPVRGPLAECIEPRSSDWHDGALPHRQRAAYRP